MLRFKSLTAKIAFISLILLVFIGGYITASYTHHMKGAGEGKGVIYLCYEQIC